MHSTPTTVLPPVSNTPALVNTAAANTSEETIAVSAHQAPLSGGAHQNMSAGKRIADAMWTGAFMGGITGAIGGAIGLPIAAVNTERPNADGVAVGFFGHLSAGASFPVGGLGGLVAGAIVGALMGGAVGGAQHLASTLSHRHADVDIPMQPTFTPAAGTMGAAGNV